MEFIENPSGYEKIAMELEHLSLGPDDYILQIEVNGHRSNEVVAIDIDGNMTWLNDWWEGESDVRLMNFMRLSDISWEKRSDRLNRYINTLDEIKQMINDVKEDY